MIIDLKKYNNTDHQQSNELFGVQRAGHNCDAGNGNKTLVQTCKARAKSIRGYTVGSDGTARPREKESTNACEWLG